MYFVFTSSPVLVSSKVRIVTNRMMGFLAALNSDAAHEMAPAVGG